MKPSPRLEPIGADPRMRYEAHPDQGATTAVLRVLDSEAEGMRWPAVRDGQRAALLLAAGADISPLRDDGRVHLDGTSSPPDAPPPVMPPS